jgi:5,10-methylenetetrahydromethanopterin reductase
MKFAIHSSARTLRDVRSRARRAEELGFDAFFVADSQLNVPDPYQALALAAQETTQILLGTAVTNFVFRDPTVIASSIATLNDACRGRAILGLGTGDGSVYSMGRKATRVADFEVGTSIIRDLLNDVGIEGAGRRLYLKSGKRPVPIYLSVEGPKGLAVAGRLADGVILGGGFDLNAISWATGILRGAAASAGRRGSDIAVMAAGMCVVGADGDRARRRVRSRAANRAHHNFRFSLETVPPPEIDGVKAFMAGFDVTQPLEERVDPELVTPYLTDRFAIAGTPKDCIRRFLQLEEFGVHSVMLTPPENDFLEVIELLATDVLPYVNK